jgi:hypothetical protein
LHSEALNDVILDPRHGGFGKPLKRPLAFQSWLDLEILADVKDGVPSSAAEVG